MLGEVRLLLGKLKAARSILVDGLKLNPRHIGCLSMLAVVEEKLGQTASARDFRNRLAAAKRAEQALRRPVKGQPSVPRDSDGAITAAQRLTEQGWPEAAVELLHQHLTDVPQDKRARDLLQVCRLAAVEKLGRMASRSMEIPPP
jgi:predicted Zn-dependent protease